MTVHLNFHKCHENKSFYHKRCFSFEFRVTRRYLFWVMRKADLERLPSSMKFAVIDMQVAHFSACLTEFYVSSSRDSNCIKRDGKERTFSVGFGRSFGEGREKRKYFKATVHKSCAFLDFFNKRLVDFKNVFICTVIKNCGY